MTVSAITTKLRREIKSWCTEFTSYLTFSKFPNSTCCFSTHQIEQQTASKKFEEEIKEEQEQRKREAAEAKQRKAAFKDKANFFVQQAELQQS